MKKKVNFYFIKGSKGNFTLKKEMTSYENSLALRIIKQNYGELTESIASFLSTKKSYPLLMIASDMNLDKKLVSTLNSQSKLILNLNTFIFRYLK